MHINNLNEVIYQLKQYLPAYLAEKGIDTSKNFSCIFPDHEDKHPSCSVYLNGNGYTGHCFSCGRSFDTISAYSILDKKPSSGRLWLTETVKELADKYGVAIQLGDLTEDQAYEIDTYRAYRAASELLDNDLEGPEFELARTEVNRRKWTKETLKKYTIGSVKDYQDFINKLKSRGFSLKFLREIDLANRTLFDSTNLIFTWKDSHGNPVGFTARNLAWDPEKKESSKYKNIKTGMKCNIFKKNSRLYGLDSAIKLTPPLYIFEGQSDVITMKQAGIENCVSFCGGNLSSDQIFLIKKHNIFEIILVLDADQPGRDKLKQILQDKLKGHKDIDVKVICLPEGEDPDSYIRTNGIEQFKKLARWSAFEWYLNQFNEEEDPNDLCSKVVPLIANEPSPLKRDKNCKILAQRTDIALKTIQDELSILLDAKAYKLSRERDVIIQSAIHQINSNPNDAEDILRQCQGSLVDLNKKHNQDTFAPDSFLEALSNQKKEEESKSNSYEGFKLSEDLKDLQRSLQGDWTRDVFMLFAGKANTGKSALFSKIAYDIVDNNEDAIVIIHSIDDTLEKVIPRLICVADGQKTLSMSFVHNPNYWKDKVVDSETMSNSRQAGYNRIIELAREGRLIVKDINSGSSISYIEGLISYYAGKGKKVCYMLDNLHKITDYNHLKDERVRWKTISQKMKQLAEAYHICICCTAEYTKIPQGQKPSNNNIAESGQFDYDANFVGHLYSEMADIPDSFTLCHQAICSEGYQKVMPRVEFAIGKNKICSIKDTFYLDFFPDSSDYKSVNIATVITGQQEMKNQRGSGNSREVDSLSRFVK